MLCYKYIYGTKIRFRYAQNMRLFDLSKRVVKYNAIAYEYVNEYLRWMLIDMTKAGEQCILCQISLIFLQALSDSVSRPKMNVLRSAVIIFCFK